MPEPEESYVEYAAAACALPIAAEDMPHVVANLRLLIAQSRGFMAIELDAETESAVTFQP